MKKKNLEGNKKMDIHQPKKIDLVFMYAEKLLARMEKEKLDHQQKGGFMAEILGHTIKQLEVAFNTKENTWNFVQLCIMPFWKENPETKEYFFDAADLEAQSELDLRKMIAEDARFDKWGIDKLNDEIAKEREESRFIN